MARWLIHTSKEGDSTTSLGKLFPNRILNCSPLPLGLWKSHSKPSRLVQKFPTRGDITSTLASESCFKVLPAELLILPPMKRRAKVPPNRFLWPNTGTGSAFTFANLPVGNRMRKKLPPEKGELLPGTALPCSRSTAPVLRQQPKSSNFALSDGSH